MQEVLRDTMLNPSLILLLLKLIYHFYDKFANTFSKKESKLILDLFEKMYELQEGQMSFNRKIDYRNYFNLLISKMCQIGALRNYVLIREITVQNLIDE